MKKTILLFMSLVLALTYAKAGDITVNGDVSGTWTKGSTITVTDHITIPVGQSLTIEEGVKVLMADTLKHLEFLVLGNLYCKGTEANPINITVKPELLRQDVDFPRSWGGIVCDTTCTEFLMLYTHVEYTGAVTTEESPSVKKGLYKAAAGEGLPIINFRNHNNGKLVIEHCTFNNAGEDGIYLEGGSYIIAYNKLYTVGEVGGDMINLKAGSIADICYNLEYSPNTNGLKLSNSGSRNPQCNPICYNNTLVNTGWRRPTVKGGGIWLEAGVNAQIYNNLHINPRFAVKNSAADAASVYDYQYYYGYDQATVDAFQAGVKDVVRGPHDVAGTKAGDNDPKLKNYDLSNPGMNTIFDTDWDFHVAANSPAIGKGTINFTRHFATTGITIAGVTYTSPEPSTTIGAFGVPSANLSVSGDVSGTWTKGSTITVTDHITIPVGQSLTIEEGVKVLMADTLKHLEFLVLGNLYCKGTEANPINITVKPELLRQDVDFPRSWGGIVCDTTCTEFLMLYTHVEYTGAVTTEESPSVKKGLYKAAAGEGLPIINFRNHNNGKLVIEHCTFNNAGEDGIYLEGGSYIIAYNKLYTVGEVGGDMINLKAGSIADICYNLEYSPNTNGLKLSNSGSRNPQCNPICYNNTLVNTGWRRPTVKGGGIWLEAGVNAQIYNNLHINPRFAVKNSAADAASVYDYQYYYGYDQATVDAFQAGVKDVVRGPHDVAGTKAGDNDPKLKNYDLSNPGMNTIFDTDWDFHVAANSPAIGKGTTNFTRHFATTGITIAGVTYTSPEPSTTIGAFDAVTAVNTLEKTEEFSVFPNPVQTELHVRFIASSSQSLVKVYSVTGELVINHRIQNVVGDNTISLAIDQLKKGLYFISLQNGSSNTSQSFLKQ